MRAFLQNVLRRWTANGFGFSTGRSITTRAAFDWDSLPPMFEPTLYKTYYPEIKSLSDEDLLSHFEKKGQAEGLIGNRLKTKADFVRLIPDELDVLEIGPYCRPKKMGPKVKYFDVLDKQGLLKRAERVPVEKKTETPHIDYVSPCGDLGIVDRQFDCVLSSHVIEHLPDLIAHLEGVERLLRPGGAYFVIVPDKRFCLDHFQSASTIAEVIDAHLSGRKVHSIKSVIEHRALETHNDRERHWKGDHGDLAVSEIKDKIKNVIKTYQEARDGYIDVHAWYFTPTSCRQIMTLLRELDFITMEVAEVYPTLRNCLDFWFVLRKP